MKCLEGGRPCRNKHARGPKERVCYNKEAGLEKKYKKQKIKQQIKTTKGKFHFTIGRFGANPRIGGGKLGVEKREVKAAAQGESLKIRWPLGCGRGN